MFKPAKVLAFPDEGHSATGHRSAFERLVGDLERTGSGGEAIVVTDLTRLFRNSADRRRIDRLLAHGRTHVVTIAEEIETWTEDGRRRYDEMADFVCLAYEGTGRPSLPSGERAAGRRELAERYLDRVLARWLELRSVPRAESEPALADVRSRLLALMSRWGTPEIEPLLAPFVEVAEWNEPRQLPVRVRAVATLAVRNSALEDLHLADRIKQADWRVITMAAAHFFAALTEDEAPAAVPRDDDPFAGLDTDFPCAYRAFTALSGLGLGETVTWEMPVVPSRALPAADIATERATGGQDVLHAMDERISNTLSDLIRSACRESAPLFFPSLKHLSRNLRKVFRVVEAMLTNGGTIATQNVLLTPARVARRARLVDYNDDHFEPWWDGEKKGRTATSGTGKVGRNDPCSCGSGKKFKRCCGQ